MIDPSRELARREAMGRLRKRITVARTTFAPQTQTMHRILIDDIYFDVDSRDLASLRAGETVEDLELSPSADQED